MVLIVCHRKLEVFLTALVIGWSHQQRYFKVCGLLKVLLRVPLLGVRVLYYLSGRGEAFQSSETHL